jgi:hypothetical protein
MLLCLSKGRVQISSAHFFPGRLRHRAPLTVECGLFETPGRSRRNPFPGVRQFPAKLVKPENEISPSREVTADFYSRFHVSSKTQVASVNQLAKLPKGSTKSSLGETPLGNFHMPFSREALSFWAAGLLIAAVLEMG